MMEYIVLTQPDIDFVSNRAVICWSDVGAVLYEPIPSFVVPHFEGRERVQIQEKDITL